jgi:hypothetical protein
MPQRFTSDEEGPPRAGWSLIESEQLLTPAAPLVVVSLFLRHLAPADAPDRIRVLTWPVVALRHQVRHDYVHRSEEDDERGYRTHEELLAAGYCYQERKAETVVLYLNDGVLCDGSELNLLAPGIDLDPLDDLESALERDPLDFTIRADRVVYATDLEQARREMLAEAEEAAAQERERLRKPTRAGPPSAPG